jgi:hypothetical protein
MEASMKEKRSLVFYNELKNMGKEIIYRGMLSRGYKRYKMVENGYLETKRC